MNNELLLPLVVVGAVGCGLMGGVFFAFSTFVMKALRRLPPATGIAAMQAINVAAITPLFMFALFGTAAVCAAVVYVALSAWSRPGSAYLLAGGSLYLIGTILVTVLGNVPRNNTLSAMDSATPAAARYWDSYVRSWTAWNHVRTIAASAAAIALTLALLACRDQTIVRPLARLD